MSGSQPLHLRRELAARGVEVLETPLTLLVAPGGYGKTTVARAWREQLEALERPVAWLSLSAAHDEPRAFLEDLLEALRAALPPRPDHQPGFADELARALSQRTELEPLRLARELARHLEALPEPLILVLDAFESLARESLGMALIDGLLRLDPCPLRLVVTTRGLRPASTARLLAADQAIEIGADDLSLRTDQINTLLREAGIDPEPALAAALLARSEGWAIAVRLTIRALSPLPPDRRLDFVRETSARGDLFEYIANELVARASPAVVSLIETAALLGASPRAVLVAACGLPDASEVVGDAIDSGLLTIDEGALALHDLWRDWLFDRMQNRNDPEALQAAHERAGLALETAGETERALRHYVAAVPRAGVEDRIIEILADRGDLWLSQGHRSIVEPALAAIDPARRAQLPALVALDGLMLSGGDPDQAIEHLKSAARAYHDAGNGRAEFMCLHELAIVAVNENRLDEVMSIYRRVLTLRKVATEPAIRAFVIMALGQGAMITGRYRMALRLLEVAATYDHHPRERGGIEITRSSITVQMGAYSETTRNIQKLLARPEQREHGITFHALEVFQASIDSALGQDPEDVRRRLAAADETFAATRNTLNHLRTLYVLGQHEQRSGELKAAAHAFERAQALATRTEFWEADAGLSGCLARVRQRLGDRDGALEAARRTVSLLASSSAWSRRRGRMLTWASGVALSCCVLAELGDGERAMAFLADHRKRLVLSDIAMAEHAVLTSIARVERRCGRAAESDKTLREAWRVAEKARLEHFSPDLDDELLAWSAREARALGLEGPSLERCLARFDATTPAPLALRSLGGLSVEIDGKRVGDRMWRGSTPKKLLMRLLAADGRPLSRDRLEADLWPDMSATRAGNNLRVALSRLRDVLEPRRRRDEGESVLELESGRVALTEWALGSWDVGHWRAVLSELEVATREGDESRAIQAAEAFAAIDREVFLPESYDDWVLDFRRGLESTAIERSRALAADWLERRGHRAARALARIALAHDAADEASWELLVTALLAEGDRSGAARACEEARTNLARELDAEPGPALQTLMGRI